MALARVLQPVDKFRSSAILIVPSIVGASHRHALLYHPRNNSCGKQTARPAFRVAILQKIATYSSRVLTICTTFRSRLCINYGKEPSLSTVRKRAKKIEFRTIARIVPARNNKQPVQSLSPRRWESRRSERAARFLAARRNPRWHDKKKRETALEFPFKINKVTPTNPRGIEIKRLGDVAEWRCRVFPRSREKWR